MPIPIHTQASISLRNPCPSGTGLGYGTFNETIFLICDASFLPADGPYTAGEMAGIIVGSVVGAGCLLALFLYLSFSYRERKFREHLQRQDPNGPPLTIHNVDEQRKIHPGFESVHPSRLTPLPSNYV